MTQSRPLFRKRNRTPDDAVDLVPDVQSDPRHGTRPWTPPAAPPRQPTDTRVLPPIHIRQNGPRLQASPAPRTIPAWPAEIDGDPADWYTTLHERNSDADNPDLPRPSRTAGAHADEVLFGLREDSPAEPQWSDGFAVQRRVAAAPSLAARAHHRTADELARANEERFVRMELCIERARGTADGLTEYWDEFERRMQRLRAEQAARDLAAGMDPKQVVAGMVPPASEEYRQELDDQLGDRPTPPDDNLITLSTHAATMRVEAVR